jgi:cell division protein ZapA
MATVNFTLRDKNYSIACEDGEEERIKKLAEKLGVRVEAMSKTCGSASDSVVLAFTALMMEDEVESLRHNGANNNEPQLPLEEQNSNNTISLEEHANIVNNSLAEALEPIAKYLENLANEIETR